MNILVCDLCRKEVEGEPMSVQFGARTLGATPALFRIDDVCGTCMDSITSFLDGLKVGPPGVSLMLPKEGAVAPEKKKAAKS